MFVRSLLVTPLLASALLAAGAAPGPAARAPVQVDGFAPVKTVGDITAYTLRANGLTVLLMPEHTSPVVTFMITYRVGSRNEVTGTTGATHLLEHLMFKGSVHFDRQQGTGYDQTLDPLGAVNNATTWFDRTNYYALSPSDHLSTLVDLEADRMRGLLLRESDRVPEMTVVRNEFERGENDPESVLMEQVAALAYIAHPYHHDVIGWRSDIEHVPIEKLRAFYDTYYWPNNATVSVIGDFDPAEALRLIGARFGAIPRSPHPIPEPYTEEPAQQGPRRLIINRVGQLGVIDLAHKIPAGTSPDYPALTVLSRILSSGKNSRLYRALTDPGLSTGTYAFPLYTHDPSLHHILIPLTPGTSHQQAEDLALAELARLRADGVTADEVSAAVSQILAESAFARDGSFAIADVLNENIAVGDWTAYYTLDEATRAVTPADVQRVARTYFIADHSTTGWFVPTASDE